MTRLFVGATREKVIEDLVRQINIHFRTFGGGRGSEFNPIAEALKDKPPSFAAGVDVRDVVEFVMNAIDPTKG